MQLQQEGTGYHNYNHEEVYDIHATGSKYFVFIITLVFRID